MSLRIQEQRYGVPFGAGYVPEPTDMETFRERPREELYFMAWLTGSLSPRAVEQEHGLSGALEMYRRRLGFMTELLNIMSKEQERRKSNLIFAVPEGYVYMHGVDNDFASDSMLLAKQEQLPVLGERMYRPSVVALIRSVEQIAELDNKESFANQAAAFQVIRDAFRVGRSMEDINMVAQPKLQDSIDFLSGAM